MNTTHTIKDIDVRGKRVILRVDFNVPMEGDRIMSDSRILATLPTIHNLLGRNAQIIIISHLGRPEGKDATCSMKPIAEHLSKLLKCSHIPVIDVDDATPNTIASAIDTCDIVILENIRFYAGEESNDDAFARKLASLGDIYVNDAFAVSHREHASIVGIPKYIPSAAGLLLDEEIRFLHFFLKSPAKPIVAIIGGKKVSSKVGVLGTYLEKADSILVGGGCANTFLKAWGDNIGSSYYEEDMLDTCRELMWKAARCNTAIILPTDAIVTSALQAGSDTATVMTTDIPDTMMIADIGPKTRERYANVIRTAGTVVWSGPMGVTEDERFAGGNDAILAAIATANVNSVVGGGDTLASIEGKKGVSEITHISTGGSATLEYIEKGTLPGIDALAAA